MRTYGSRLKPTSWSRRWRGLIATVAALGIMALVSGRTVSAYAGDRYDRYQQTRVGYEAQNGRWDIITLPGKMKVNAIHAALLRTGKVLLIAGSGNNIDNFQAGTFKTLLWDPSKGDGASAMKLIPTPADMFCGGHAFLPDGNLLVAGGTRKYEVLASKVTNAAGKMTIQDESPGKPIVFPAGTRFVSPDGLVFASTDDVTVPAALKVVGAHGRIVITAGQAAVWVQAVKAGKSQIVATQQHYTIPSIPADESNNVFGIADSLTLDKQEFEGINKAYEFDVTTERYVQVGMMSQSRWYPTLTRIPGDKILAVSGLDQFGQISKGQTEVFDQATQTWSKGPFRYFPTYPSLIMLADGNLFYSGSNTGYGSATVGRTPGIWNLKTNTFRKVPDLPVPQDMETSGTILLPPAQNQRIMVIGGGAVGDSDTSTERIAVANLKSRDPRFQSEPNLCVGTRYPSSVILPNDQTFITGGSSQYRGDHDSDNHDAYVYTDVDNPSVEGTLTKVAPPEIGRNYHSGAILLPDGTVLTFGSDPLYGNASDTIPGTFETRLEIYRPSYLFGHGARPTITGGPTLVRHGATVTYTVPDAAGIRSVRLMRPSAVTHMTDTEQSSASMAFTADGSRLSVTVPADQDLVPDDWYMLYVINDRGVPSIATWVQVSR